MTLHVTELAGAAFSDTLAAEGKTLKYQGVTVGNTSNTFQGGTKIIRLEPEENCHVALGVDPTATTNDEVLLAGRTYHKAVTKGEKISTLATA